MLYDQLAEIHSDLEWALLEIRLKVGAGFPAVERADAALARLGALVAALAGHGGELPTTPSH
jgi:hypothetical protein